jgi:hypothetical protein
MEKSGWIDMAASWIRNDMTTYPTDDKRAVRKFQVMPEICRKFSRYARKEFHLMTESSGVSY